MDIQEALDVLKLLTDTVRVPVYIEAMDTVAAECRRLRDAYSMAVDEIARITGEKPLPEGPGGDG